MGQVCRIAAWTGMAFALAIVSSAGAQNANWGNAGRQADYVVKNFKFTTGEVMPELKLHYTTLGQPKKDAQGKVRNAVIILHGTGGSGRSFMSGTYAGELFGPGKLLDSSKFYIVLPDGIGHGGSSKPSDGLRTKFPKYTYDDMVVAQYKLLNDGLNVNHLRLIMGTSMGCMQAWVWGYTYPDFMDGLAPLACVPAQIAGRNRMIRTMAMDNIRTDPAWNGGNYTSPPPGLRGAMEMLYIMGTAPLVQHSQAPTRDKADEVIRAHVQIERPGKQLVRHLKERNVEETAGVAHEQVEFRLRGERSANQIGGRGGLQQIESEIRRTRGHRRRRGVLAVKKNAPALLMDGEGNGVTNALGRTRHQGAFTGEREGRHF